MSKHDAGLSLPNPDREYLDFDLDAETMAAVKKLAAEAKTTPFEMCVILMQESIASRGNASPGRG